jgi:hypothetical protein
MVAIRTDMLTSVRFAGRGGSPFHIGGLPQIKPHPARRGARSAVTMSQPLRCGSSAWRRARARGL